MERHGSMGIARSLFDGMPERDSVSWNTLISAYLQNGNPHKSVDLYLRMRHAPEGHDLMERHGSMGIARSLFDGMPERDSVSWNTLISAYLQNGNPHKSVDLYLRMRRIGISADRTTFAAVALKACSAFEEYDMGIQIHGLTVKIALDLDVVTGSAIVDMYAKCKSLANSHRFFHGMPVSNWILWSAVIGGCVLNERFLDGLEVFIEMEREGVGVSQSVWNPMSSLMAVCSKLVRG